MKTKIILSTLMAALIPGLAFALPPAGKGMRQIDTNGDGVVTRDEATAAEAFRLIEDFDEIDADGNDELTREELKNFHQQRRQQGRQRAESADTDGNGALSLAEAEAAGMQRLVDNFSTLDRNADGEVTREEMQAMQREKRAKIKEGVQSRAGNGQGSALKQP